MMKKLIVLGIVAMMVMGLAATAMADATAWAVFLRASTDAAGKLGSFGTFQAGTKGTATDEFNTADGDAYFSGTLNPVAAVFEPAGTQEISKDFRAPIGLVPKTWNVTFAPKNGAGAGYLTMWNQTGATADVPSDRGWAVTLYHADANFVKGAAAATLDTALNGSFSQTGAGFGGTFYQVTEYGNYVLEVGPAVPEPASVLALVTGLVGLVGIRRRK